MRVLCVDGQRRVEDIGTEPLLTEGTTYRVEEEVYGMTSDGKVVDCYKLSEVEFPFVYQKDRFVLCDDDGDAEEETTNTRESLKIAC